LVSITLSVPEEVRIMMRRFPEVNWSALVRKSIMNKINEINMKEEAFKQLKKEESFNDWAVKLIRKGRRDESRS